MPIPDLTSSLLYFSLSEYCQYRFRTPPPKTIVIFTFVYSYIKAKTHTNTHIYIYYYRRERKRERQRWAWWVVRKMGMEKGWERFTLEAKTNTRGWILIS